MVIVDPRVGSANLLGYLRHWGVECVHEQLDFGDAAFLGQGPDGPIMIGVEVKAVRDALNCMDDGRFAGHQLPGLISTYGHVWLVVEGDYSVQFNTGFLVLQSERSGRNKVVEAGERGRRPPYTFAGLTNWLTSMECCAGLHVRRTRNRIETARFIGDLHSWWSKDWARHRSHLALHETRPDQAILIRPNIVRKMAAQLGGIGWTRSGMVSARFKTVKEMVDATVEDWMGIEGIGKMIAQAVWRELHQP